MPAIFGAQPDGSKLLVGKGRVLFNRLTPAGVKTGEKFLGNCEEFSINVSENVLKKFTSVDGSSGLLARIPNQREAELSIKLNEVTQFNSALALVGTTGVLAQTGATATDETITPAGGSGQGLWYKLSKHALTSITNVKDDTVTIASNVNNVNYYIDMPTGMLFVTPGGSIVDGSVITVTYVYPTESPTIISGLDANVKGLFRFVGDPAGGPIVEVEVWNTIIQADAALSLISEDFAEYTLKAAVLYDIPGAALTPSCPYFRMMFR